MKQKSFIVIFLTFVLGLFSLAWAATITVGPSGDYTTIQAAINAAQDGDTIEVAAGTYFESIQITKPLTLKGANAGIPGFSGSRLTESEIVAATSGVHTIAFVGTIDNITIDGFKIVGNVSNSNIYCGVDAPGNLNIINNFIYNEYLGYRSNTMYAINYRCSDDPNYIAENINISYNYFKNEYGENADIQKGTAAIWLGQSSANALYQDVVIEGNVIEGYKSFHSDFNTSGIYIGTGWGAGNGKVNNPIIRNNTIKDLSGYKVYGIYFEGNAPGAEMYGNIFENLTGIEDYVEVACIAVENTSDQSTGVKAYNNDLSGAEYGVLNRSANFVDATKNWWGDISGPYHAVTNTTGLVVRSLYNMLYY